MKTPNNRLAFQLPTAFILALLLAQSCTPATATIQTATTPATQPTEQIKEQPKEPTPSIPIDWIENPTAGIVYEPTNGAEK